MIEKKKNRQQTLVPVFIIALVCCIIIFVANKLTSDQIDLNKHATAIEMIETVMPLTYDNDLYNDRMDIAELSTTVYRARFNADNAGLVFMPVSTMGYKDTIKMAIGLSYEGVIIGVRIIEQHETVDLGDNIDQKNSDWINNFDDRSLKNTPDAAWAVANDDGDFDQLSGATISPRSVINAVKNTLDFYEVNRDSLYK
jgi:H+/Na+-translocating ferredoxin:NAD+ oxidoreductase subunit G